MRKQSRNKKRIILGLTGSFGSGKTTVAKMFKSFGAEIIDADRIAHELVKPKNKIYKKIIDTFGKRILKEDGRLNREKLAKIVFNDVSLLKLLNKIIHPEIIKIIKNKIMASRSKVIILDAPLLIETGLDRRVDKLIVVKIDRKKQIERVIKKTSLNKKDILKRIKHELPLENKIRLADFEIDNSETVNNTKRQVIRVWKELRPQSCENQRFKNEVRK